MGGCLYRAVNVCTLWIHSFDLGDISPMIIWDGSLFWRTPHIQKQARTQKNSNPNHPLPWNLDWWWFNHQQFHFMGDFLIPTLGWGLVSSLRNQPTRGRESPKKIMENTPITWVESPRDPGCEENSSPPGWHEMFSSKSRTKPSLPRKTGEGEPCRTENY